MTKQLWTVVVFAIAAGGVRAEEKPAFKNDNEKFSYAQGMEFGVWLNRQEMGADFDALLRGLKDTVSSNQTLLSEQEMREALRDGRTKLQTKRPRHSSPKIRPSPASSRRKAGCNTKFSPRAPALQPAPMPW